MSEDATPALPHLSTEFFIWLWFASERNGGTMNLPENIGVVDVWVEDRLSFRGLEQEKARAVVTGDNTASSLEARAALATGKVVRDIQLQRRDTEIEQDAVHARKSGAFDRPGDAVVDGVHRDQAVTEPGETLGGDAQGVGVAVEPDHRQRGKPLQQRLGVPAHSERRVHHDGVLAAERGSQQLDAALEEDGGMDVAQVHDVGPDHWALIPTR